MQMKPILDIIISDGDGCVWPGFEKWLIHEDEYTTKAEAAIKAAFPNIEDVGDGLLLTDLETAYKDIGFKNGFRTAVRLMMECLT